MKPLGISFIITSAVLAIAATLLPNTVSGTYNIGLLARQVSLVVAAGAMLVSGIACYGIAIIADTLRASLRVAMRDLSRE